MRLPDYFQNQTIGCRDLYTLDFCQKNGIDAYFSRCLTLTLPKRQKTPEKPKVFLVGLNDGVLKNIPPEILKNAEIINQQNVALKPADDYFAAAQHLLDRYQNEATLIITSALHCASPATALGIPVVFFLQSEEQKTRFSTLQNILPLYTLEDLRRGNVNWNPTAPDIEPLKNAMLCNLRLSLAQLYGESVDLKERQTHRQTITTFSTLSQKEFQK